MTRRGALQVLAERSGSDSDECMFDQTNLLQRRRTDITRLRTTTSTISGHRLTIARTVNLCLAFFALGLCFAMPTATITGLQYRTSSSEGAIGNIYRARYGGYIVGCFAGGFLFNHYNRQFLLFLALLATAIGIFVMPFCQIQAVLMTCTCVTGITMGLLDTGGNVWLLDLWGRKSAPFMQTMHFCFGLGALVAPLVAQPFIGAYSQLGPQGSFNESRSFLLPISIRSPKNPYCERVRRETNGIFDPNKTLPHVTQSTTAQIPLTRSIFTTASVEHTKPSYVDTILVKNQLHNPPAFSGASPKNEHSSNTITLPRTTDKSTNSSSDTVPSISRPLQPSVSTDTTKKISASSARGSRLNVTTPCSTCYSTTITARSSGHNFLNITSSPTSRIIDSAHIVVKTSANSESLSSHATVKVMSTTTTYEPPTKISASIVPSEENGSSIASDFITSKKQHSIKKVLPDDKTNLSWLGAARHKIQESGKFEIAYAILAAYVLVVSIVFLIFLCLNPREGRSKQEDELDDSNLAQGPSRMRVLLILLMCSFFFLYMGIEVAVGETLKSLFERGELITQVVSGEQLVYIFWGSFAFARAVSIFISVKMSYRSMLIVDIVICLFAALMLVKGTGEAGLIVAGIVCLAFGMASIIPTLFIWLERCAQVSNRLSALLILSAAAGEMFIPEVVSAFTKKTPLALIYVILSVIILCSVNLTALCYVTSIRGEKYVVKPDRSLYQLASLDDDIEHWNQGARKNDHQREGVIVKRNKNNSFFYNRLNNLDS